MTTSPPRTWGSRARRRMLLLLVAVAYVGALEGVWPLVTRQDYLPFAPLASKHLPWPTPLGSDKQNAASPRSKS